MQKPIFFLLLLFFSQKLISQKGGFPAQNNDLIYDEATVQQLRHMVDSMNLRFKACDFTQPFRARWQLRAKYVYLENDSEQAQQDMAQGIDFESFVKKYPTAETSEKLILKSVLEEKPNAEWGQEGGKWIELTFFPGEESFRIDFDPRFHDKDLRGRWLFEYHKPTEYPKKGYVKGVFLEKNFEPVELPESYARLVQYSEYMVDTTTTTYLSDFEADEESKPRPVKQLLLQYIEIPGKPLVSDWKEMRAWEVKRDSHMRTIAHLPEFRKLLAEAVDEAIANNVSDKDLEKWTGNFYSRKKQLHLMRLRRVWGMCSQDDRPRRHALAIAELAAETVSWEIFLRSHLDIMTDYFSRSSDGPYAWGTRGTYVRELEAIGINVPMLLLGVSLRVENTAKNHYFGNIERTGRALAECSHLQEVEAKLRQSIADPSLDEFNRLIFYNLYRSISSWKTRTDERAKEQLETELKFVQKLLPAYLTVEKKG